MSIRYHEGHYLLKMRQFVKASNEPYNDEPDSPEFYVDARRAPVFFLQEADQFTARVEDMGAPEEMAAVMEAFVDEAKLDRVLLSQNAASAINKFMKLLGLSRRVRSTELSYS